MGPAEGLSRWPLEEGPSARVERRAQEIVVAGVADVELDRRRNGGEIDKVRSAQLAGFLRRRRRERFLPQLGQGPARLYAKGLAVLAVHLAPCENDFGGLHLGGPAGGIAREDQLL